MANGGDYAAYENLPAKHYSEGLTPSYAAFHDDVTAAYVKCMTTGQVPTDAPTDADTLRILAEELGDAIHKFMLSAIIDTTVTVPAQPVTGIAPVDADDVAAAPADAPVSLGGPDAGPIEEQTGTGEGHLE